jgi:hypothetical protein
MQKAAGLPGAVRDMLRLVLAEVERAPQRERKKAAVQQMWLRLDTAKRLAKTLKMPVDSWWLSIIKEVEASDDPLEVLKKYLGVREARRRKAEARPDPSLATAEVEERLALFDRVVREVLRDPEGVEKAVHKKAEFFEAFYKWAKSALRRDLPERLGAKLRSALEVAYYCRPGGLMYAAKEAEEQKKPLPPELPAVYAVKNYAKTWLQTV